MIAPDLRASPGVRKRSASLLRRSTIVGLHQPKSRYAMKAVRINQVSDDLSGIELVDIPVPDPGPGLVRVRMLKAAVHPSDLLHLR